MIVLDTNVVSAVMKPSSDPVVRAWLNEQATETLYLSSVTLAELLFGIGSLPMGRRKESLAGVLEGLFELFGPRILPFDAVAARSYAEIAVRARAGGRGFPLADGFIAATAAAHGFMVATRDTGPFEAAGLTVINPWETGQ
ncbi:type II toxin-antitoxin system VapC family toxin [Reyranella sp. CPCC 100927]|uniref:type II toxin-antitoxin system VapC family toxin n=1 Tax=Reyranella sp. CPCC 100927 TaxID=2599616 RepID=UPI0011B78655|nr:type II toxin-antitoxin system VapC family toxin [Reyranella sp. CPCC 100927]TWS93366.1 type II toxin-antitoxin system VapC family toxin [Reyranella sp. CPCC 100927]